MDQHINIIDNKEYYYVISYYTPSNDFLRNGFTNTDISIFEIDEWEELLIKSKLYNECVRALNSESDESYMLMQLNKTHSEYSKAVYYLYNGCEFCKYSDFTSLEYYVGNNFDINECVFAETKNENRYNVSIDGLRKWIVHNYDDLIQNYNIIKAYEN
jgi:hypothetical protein